MSVDSTSRSKRRKLKVNELVDVDVLKVSLVDAGANKLPFRITKSEENQMGINMDQIFRKKEVIKSDPFVSSVVVSKSADLDEAKAKIEKMGFSIEKMEEKDEVIVFGQAEGEVDALYKMQDEEIALGITGIEKGFDAMDFETASFKELFSKQGVVPSLYAATDSLMSVMFNIFEKAESDKDVTKMARKALKEYSAAVEKMVSEIPASAFKADFMKFEEEEVEKSEGEAEEGEAEEVEKSEEKSEGKEEVEKSEEKSEDNEKVEKEEEAEGEEAEEKEEAEKSEESSEQKDTELGEVLKAISALTEDVQSLKKSQEESAVDLESKIEGVKQLAEKADEAVNGFTTNVEQTDREVTTKSEKKGYKPLVIDTAYSARRENAQS